MEKIKELSWKQALKKYGECKIKFSSYYKYQFSFTGVCGDIEIYLRDGGDSSNIYRYEVNANEEVLVKTFKPNNLQIIKDGKVIEEYYDNY